MKKEAIIFIMLFLIVSTSYIAYAIHEEVEIPPEFSSIGHYEKMPRASGGDLRHFITSHQPYKKWATWPGKGKMYRGTEPHGHFITVHINDIAAKSLKERKGMANNAIILKENYNRNRELASITVMYKVKGYNPEGGDWFWTKYDHRFKIVEEGKVRGCLDCHSNAKENDFIFTGSLTKN